MVLILLSENTVSYYWYWHCYCKTPSANIVIAIGIANQFFKYWCKNCTRNYIIPGQHRSSTNAKWPKRVSISSESGHNSSQSVISLLIPFSWWIWIMCQCQKMVIVLRLILQNTSGQNNHWNWYCKTPSTDIGVDIAIAKYVVQTGPIVFLSKVS